MKVRARLSLRWASLLPTRKQLVVFLREILAQTERTTTRANAGSTSERRWWKSSKNRFIASNNVGVEIAKIFFVSIAYCPWCARRDSNPHDVTHCHLKAARLPIPRRALRVIGTGNLRRTGSTARDVTNQGWRDKARRRAVRLAGPRGFRQHLLDFHGDAVAIDQH